MAPLASQANPVDALDVGCTGAMGITVFLRMIASISSQARIRRAVCCLMVERVFKPRLRCDVWYKVHGSKLS